MKVKPVAVESTIGHQTAIGGTWMIGARLISRVVDLGTMLVLARILHPQDFGLVAIAMTMIYIVEAALELPVSQALVRLPVISAAEYDTAFTLSFARGVILSLILCSISVPFAHVYGDRRLIPLICALSLAPAARGLVSPRLADFAKNLNFSRDFAIELIGKLLAFVVAITLAVTLRTYWSIAAGTVAAPLTAAIASYVIAPYRPRLTLSALSSFSGFLGWITVAQVISAVNWQTDRLLLGKLTSRAELGLFTTANDVANIPLMTLLGPILRPLLSAFAMLRHDMERLQKSYQTSSAALVTVALPLLVGESLIARPAVTLLFGEKWLGAAPMLKWLAISLIPSLFAMPFGPLVMTLDRTHIFVKRNALEICVKLPLVVLGAIRFQFFGVIFARLISEAATVVFCMIVVRRLIGLSVREQMLAPWRGICSALAMAAVLAFAVPRLTQTTAMLPLAMGTVLSIALGAATYAGVLLTLWSLAGRPAGIEAMTVRKLSDLVRRPNHTAAAQPL